MRHCTIHRVTGGCITLEKKVFEQMEVDNVNMPLLSTCNVTERHLCRVLGAHLVSVSHASSHLTGYTVACVFSGRGL